MTEFNQPLGGSDMPRFAGRATMVRLPSQPRAAGRDTCFVGVPLGICTSNRSGTRRGPRQTRARSCMLRPFNLATGARPFESARAADIGRGAINTFDLTKTMGIIEAACEDILSYACKPLTLGGGHALTLPILRATHKVHGPVALIRVDVCADVNDEMFGEKIAHGTPFRRAVEEGLLTCDKAGQIALRGADCSPEDLNWTRSQGFTDVQAEDCWHQAMKPLMARVRAVIGDDPVYLTCDFDNLDPAFAPGTGTVAVGALSIWQALEIKRDCRGLNLIGADLVAVGPPHDPSGNTASIAANFIYETLCVRPGVSYGG